MTGADDDGNDGHRHRRRRRHPHRRAARHPASSRRPPRSSRPAPGGDFTFNVVVTNTGTEPVTITSLTDDVYGNLATRGTCTTAIGTVLPPPAARYTLLVHRHLHRQRAAPPRPTSSP